MYLLTGVDTHLRLLCLFRVSSWILQCLQWYSCV